MAASILSTYILAVLAPWLYWTSRRTSGWLLSTASLVLVAYFAAHIGTVAQGRAVREVYDWVPSLGLQLSFSLDGLSLLFGLVVTFIGALVVLYGGGYLAGHPLLGRFYAFLFLFMGSMLGVVLSDNLLTLFVFWELTSLASYLLIGFAHEREAARSAALQALLITGLGGLALLAGFLLLGQVAGTMEISELLSRAEDVKNHSLYSAILVLVLLGAFTKSAQFPFHFWLPNAMEAPAPVSAYLHAATMVKAGVYLLARLHPVLGGTDVWLYVVTGFGLVTMVLGAYLAARQSQLKLILAYSTVSSLGTLIFLLGLGTPKAVEAAMVYFLGHALCKGALFLSAGIVDHETGETNVERLGGLRSAMPVTAVVTVLAGLSLAGAPPFLGFVGKEVYFEAALNAPLAGGVLAAAATVTTIFMVTAAGLVVLRPFFGLPIPRPQKTHEGSPSLLIGPAVLAILGLAFGLFSASLEKPLLAPAVFAVLAQPVSLDVAVWHGLTPALGLSAIAFALGFFIYAKWDRFRAVTAVLEPAATWGPSRAYDLALAALNTLARSQTRFLQSGYLRFYLLTIIMTTGLAVGYTLLSPAQLGLLLGSVDVRFHETILAILILSAALATVRFRTRLAAIAAMGVVGYGVGLVFLLFGAPDLAMTQFVIETLTVILFVLAFYRLPAFASLSSSRSRARDAAVALAAGGMMTVLILTAAQANFHPTISEYYGEASLTLAHGRNVVNVILVDFRGLDTLGEITVLAVAAVGVYALLRFKPKEGGR